MRAKSVFGRSVEKEDSINISGYPYGKREDGYGTKSIYAHGLAITVHMPIRMLERRTNAEYPTLAKTAIIQTRQQVHCRGNTSLWTLGTPWALRDICRWPWWSSTSTSPSFTLCGTSISIFPPKLAPH